MGILVFFLFMRLDTRFEFLENFVKALFLARDRHSRSR